MPARTCDQIAVAGSANDFKFGCANLLIFTKSSRNLLTVFFVQVYGRQLFFYAGIATASRSIRST